ncbi:hypothetical protein [Cellulomonas sp. Marseille-Q8402]
MQSEDLVRAQNAYQVLDVLGQWLVWVVLAMLAAGVLLARHTARALVIAGLALAGGCCCWAPRSRSGGRCT